MKSTTIYSTLLVFFLLHLSDLSAGLPLDPSEVSALQSFFTVFHGGNWRNKTGWRFDESQNQPGLTINSCEPQYLPSGVTCKDFGSRSSVVAIELREYYAYNDDTPANSFYLDLTPLANLVILDLSINGGIESSYPNLLDHLPNSLQTLNLSRCNIRNSVINPIIAPQLSTLDLSYNYGLRQMPPMENLSRLKYLSLRDCGITAVFPSYFSSFKDLEYLSLNGDGWSGDLSSLKDLQNIKFLKVSETNILTNGSFIANNKNMEHIDFFNNRKPQDSMVFPTIGTFSNLVYLDVHGNNMNGNISSIKDLIHLEYLDILYSGITGDTSLLGRLENLSFLHLGGPVYDSNNIDFLIPLKKLKYFIGNMGYYLTAPFPDLSASNLIEFTLTDTRLVGQIKEIGGDLQLLSIGGNRALDKQRFPSWVCNKRNLTSLYFYLSTFYGTIPDDCFSNFNSLRGITLNNLQLEGNIPSTLCNLTAMTYVDLSSNFLTGRLCEFKSLLDSVFVSSNALSGDLPAFLSSCRFRSMELANNQFTGGLPTFNCTENPLSNFKIQNNQISGTIPSLFNIRNMGEIDLSNNLLYGKIPQYFSELNNLYKFSISGNQFSGEMFPITKLVGVNLLDISKNQLSSLPESTFESCPSSLQKLYMQGNRFEGNAPRSVMNCTQLRILDMSNNLFTGSLFPVDSPQLTRFSIKNCFLTGEIPPVLSPLLNLLDLSGNRLNGSFPDLTKIPLNSLLLRNNLLSGDVFLLPPTLNLIDISYNDLTGQIRFNTTGRGYGITLIKLDCSHNRMEGNSDFLNSLSPERVEYLDISANNFTGSFDLTFLNQLYNMRYLDISSNQFSYTLNSPVGQINCRYFNISHNQFGGKITYLLKAFEGGDRYYGSDVYFPSQLEILDVGYNSWSGKVAGLDAITQLQYLDLSNNNMNGEVENTLPLLLQLKTLKIQNNQFEGEFPAFPSSSQISIMDLSNNQFNGRRLDYLFGITGLVYLNISNNLLAGSLPQTFGSKSLSVLDFSHNQIRGELSDEFINLGSLLTIKINDNQLNGGISPIRSDPQIFDASNNQFNGTTNFLDRFAAITFLNISSNQFEGSLPDLGGKKNMIFMDLSHNHLSGTVSSFSGMTNLKYASLNGNALTGTTPSVQNGVLEYFDLRDNLFSETSFEDLPNTIQTCHFESNVFDCPISSPSIQLCNAQCSVKNKEPAYLYLKMNGDYSTFEPNKFVGTFSSVLGISSSRIEIIKSYSGSIIVEMNILPPPTDSMNEGSSDKVITSAMKLKDNGSFQKAGLDVALLSTVAIAQPITNNQSVNDNNKDGLSTAIIIAIAVGGGVALLIVVALVIAVILFKRRRSNSQDSSVSMQSMMDQLMLNDVVIGKVIGEGNFGKVYDGTWNGSTVAIKSITDEDDEEIARKWKDEIRLLHKMNHPNIIRLFGLVKVNARLCMVIEFAEYGSVDRYLKNPENADNMSNNDLVTMIYGIAQGMSYLSHRGVIHRDLAARNLLLDAARRVKISDFGMSKESGLYEVKAKTIPYRWCAPEVIHEGINTIASDVWSFGVCSWEIFSLGTTPYNSLTNQEVVEKVTGGMRLDQPSRCSDNMYQILTSCWQNNPKDRPTFNQICKELTSLYPNLLKNATQIVEDDEASNAGIYMSDRKMEESSYSFSPGVLLDDMFYKQGTRLR
eukprot:TRINITY_DN2114_c0_g3_i1.p1 TRINITY_DN2114_c0_g3~~TRINITY_DN2114_c0_g3_i1.p1  ORF type:complete len:1670 (-),score=397.19 TRINITY_DN2114_c0_g3_i1:2-5011(-)